METYDVIVIGSGQGGGPLAGYCATQLGLKTALIEKSHAGGTCVNTGCTPTKTLIASAKAAHTVRQASRYGVHSNNLRIDYQTVKERKDQVVDMFRSGSYKGLTTKENLTYMEGHARFTGKKTLTVSKGNEHRELQADKIFINTGTRTFIPPVKGIEDVPVLDNASLLELEELPEKLLIVGGNVIGVEFGQLYQRLGSEVQLFHAGSRLMEMEDEDVSEELEKILTNEGIKVYTNCRIKEIRKEGNDVILSDERNGTVEDFRCTHILMAPGRTPNTDDLGLENTAVETDPKGYIQVDDNFATTQEGVYALGDVIGGLQFTHVSYDHYRLIRDQLFEQKKVSIKDRIPTYTVFTDPQIGRAGLNEQQAKEQGLDYRVAKLPLSSVARGIETDHTKGFMKVLVSPGDGKILGATMFMDEGGELSSVLLMAMMGGLTAAQIREAMLPHPTYAESLNNLFSSLD